jgi:hypothetical protein
MDVSGMDAHCITMNHVAELSFGGKKLRVTALVIDGLIACFGSVVGALFEFGSIVSGTSKKQKLR